MAFTGRFDDGPGYDEARYARDARRRRGLRAARGRRSAPTTSSTTIRDVVYHLDYPVAGPGSFPQYIVSRLAARHRKVVLGGQGGDEIFGGYARYLLAYFEQCIKAAIDGTMHNGNVRRHVRVDHPATSSTLRAYKPLIQEFWREGLFGDLDERYFRLVNRAPALDGVDRLERARRLLAVRDVPRDLPRRQRRPGVVLRPDDALRLQDAPPGAAPGRGSREHGARARVAHAVRRPRGGRVRGDAAGARQVPERRAEARAQARARRPPAARRFSSAKDKMGFPVPLDRVGCRGRCETSSATSLAPAHATRPYLSRGRRSRASSCSERGRVRPDLWGLLCSSSGSRRSTTAPPTGGAPRADDGTRARSPAWSASPPA